jgi:hypothetical protein
VQVAKENRKKMLLWLSGPAEQQGASTTQPGQLPAAADAVKQRGFRPLQLPGSSIAAAAAQPAASTGPSWQQALKFWQVGTQNSKQPGLSRAAADQQPSKSLSSLLFGNNKSKRQSSAGADASGSRLLSIDPAASWRSSADGSVNGRRSGSNRSSEAGGAAAAAVSGGSAGAERGAVLSSLAAGEGPLSKSHSLLATKPVAQQEQILGQALEIVAEDEREGRGGWQAYAMHA